MQYSNLNSTHTIKIYCYLKRENFKVLKFPMNNPSYFEISASLFQTPYSNKRRRTLKLRN